MPCQKCNSKRIVSVNAKCSDLCHVSVNGKDNDGYVPDDLGIGGGDYVEFDMCLTCGQVQGKFPLPTAVLEAEEDEPTDVAGNDEEATGDVTDLDLGTVEPPPDYSGSDPS